MKLVLVFSFVTIPCVFVGLALCLTIVGIPFGLALCYFGAGVFVNAMDKLAREKRLSAEKADDDSWLAMQEETDSNTTDPDLDDDWFDSEFARIASSKEL